MGAGGGVVPSPCSFTPTQAPCHRQAPLTHAESHHDTSVPMQAHQRPTAPRGRGPAHRRGAHAAPSPSLRCRRRGTCTPQHDAVIGTRVVGAVVSVAPQWGFGRSHAAAGVSRAPTTWTRYTCVQMITSALAYNSPAHTRVLTHMHTLCHAPCPSPQVPFQGSQPAWSCAAHREHSWL